MDYRSPVRHPVALAVVVMAIAITSNHASIMVRGGGYLPPFADTKVLATGPCFGLGPRLPQPFSATKPSPQTTGAPVDVHHHHHHHDVHRVPVIKQHVDNKKKQHQQHLLKLFKTTTTTTTKTTSVATKTTTTTTTAKSNVQRSTTPVPVPYDTVPGQVQPTTTTPQPETTTQDRSIITAPKMCPEGQRMNPDRMCVQILPPPVEFKDPDSYNN